MNLKIGTRASLVVLPALLGAAPAAWAGGPIPAYIDYGPLAPSSVPTLGQWALFLMALLIGVVAYRALRGRVNGRLLAHLLLGGGVLAGSVAGGDWLRSAQADAVEVALSQAAGGSQPLEYVEGDVKVINASPVAQQIKALRIVVEGLRWEAPSSSPRCMAGLTTLQPNGFCYVRLSQSDGPGDN